MKDLKHLIYFEDLLQEAQNELVTQAVNEGKTALGYNCYYIPEVLLNLPGCWKLLEGKGTFDGKTAVLPDPASFALFQAE